MVGFPSTWQLQFPPLTSTVPSPAFLAVGLFGWKEGYEAMCAQTVLWPWRTGRFVLPKTDTSASNPMALEDREIRSRRVVQVEEEVWNAWMDQTYR